MSSRKRNNKKSSPARPAKGGKVRPPAKKGASVASKKAASTAAVQVEVLSSPVELADEQFDAVVLEEAETALDAGPDIVLDVGAPAVSEITELRPRSADSDSDSDSNTVDDEAQPATAEASEAAADELEVEPPVEAPATRAHLKRLIESLIFVSDQIITPLQIARIVKAKQPEVRELVSELSAEYEGRGIELVEVAGGYQFRSAAASAPFVRDLVAQRPVRLTRAQLETLALIAYRQPITRPEIDDVRGVDSGSAIKVLLERDLVKILGRKDEAGRPLLYGTAPYFLEFFSMKGMQDLPTLREFTELNEEHRELFQRKTGEIPDLSAETFTAGSESIASESDEDENEDDEADQQVTGEFQAVEARDATSEASEASEDTASESEPVADMATDADADFDAEATTAEHARVPDMADMRDVSEDAES